MGAVYLIFCFYRVKAILQNCKQGLELRITFFSPLPCPPLFFKGLLSSSTPRQLQGAGCSAELPLSVTPHLCVKVTYGQGFILCYGTNPKKLFFCSTLGHHTLGRLLIPASLGLADAPCFLPSTPTMATLRLP